MACGCLFGRLILIALCAEPFWRGEGALNPYGREHVVRTRRRLKENRYFAGKRIYKREQLELTIPSKFREVVEPFLDKDLQVTAKQTSSNSLILEIKPVERTGENL